MPASAKDRALRLLGVRSRSREELRRCLSRVGFPEEEVAGVLDDLERVGLVDDGQFAEEVVRDRMGRRGFGPRAAMATLLQAGVSREIAERAVADGAGDDEEARAEEVARRRLRRLANLPPDVAARRLLDFLLRRGFDQEVAGAACRRVLAEADHPR